MRQLLIAAFALAACLAGAQTFPFELASHRVPSVQTGGNCLIKNAQILTVTNGDIARGDILVRDGKIAQIGRGLRAPDGFVVIDGSLPAGVEKTHVSLFDGTLEGLAVTGKPAFSVQYHPEASPGPHDSHYLFERFVRMIDDKTPNES